MIPTKEDEYSLRDIFTTTKNFIRYLFLRWWLMLLAIGAGIGIGVAYYHMQQPKYKAVCTFILEEKSGGGGGLSGLASQFGLNIGGLSGGSLFSGDNILNILKSKKVVQRVLLSPADDTGKNGQTLADYYLQFTGIVDSWKEKSILPGFGFANTAGRLSPVQDSVLNAIYETIIAKNVVTERISKQSTIIRVQVTATNPMFARLMTERIIDEASKLYLDIRVGTAQDNIRQLQKRSDSLLALVNSKTFRAAASQPLDINPGLRTASVPTEIATRDKAVLGTLYTEVTKNLEASRMILSQQTPVIQLLDQPGLLLNDNRKSLLFILIVSCIAAGAVYVAIAFVFFLMRPANRKSQLSQGRQIPATPLR